MTRPTPPRQDEAQLAQIGRGNNVADMQGVTFAQLEAGLRIDKNDLDGSLLRQNDLFWRVSKKLTLEISRRDEAKQVLAEEEARIATDVRHRLSVAGERATDSKIDEAQALSASVKPLRENVRRLNLSVGMFSALKDAYIQRGYVLKEMVGLWIANYYSDHIERGSKHDMRDVAAAKVKQYRREQST